MPSIVFYFKVHQPHRLKPYTIFDIGQDAQYFDEERNKFYLDRIVTKCYRPTLKLIRSLIEETNGRFKVSFGLTGTLIEQLQLWHPDIIELFQDLATTGSVEFTGETYYHSLACLYSLSEFRHQVEEHRQLIRSLFKMEPVVFSNTELIYFNDLSKIIQLLGFKGIITEGVPWILGWRSPNFVYHSLDGEVKLLLRNFQLSDDISFRFSAKWWEAWPLTADKLAQWLAQFNGNGEVINLFMDFETFGEHQWPETGIFEFLANLPFEVFKQRDLDFALPKKVIKRYISRDVFNAPQPITWADTERDLTAWLGNEMQKEALWLLYSLQPKLKQKFLPTWRKLQTADHFYYMCTKWFADGDVHKYFNPYENPYQAYLLYRNILEDLILKNNS